MRSILIVGATGLVERAVLRIALEDASIVRVAVPTRRPLGFEHGKLVNPLYAPCDGFLNREFPSE